MGAEERVLLGESGGQMTILHTQLTDKALAYETGRWDARGRVCVICTYGGTW